MTADARIPLDWVGGNHQFRLAIGELRMLQEKCKAGPAAIYDRLRHRTWLVDDVREVVRLGLIGGGMSAAEAERLTKAGIDGNPLMLNVALASAILAAALIGVPDDPVGKGGAEMDASGTATKMTAVSPSPQSTEPAQQ